MKFKKNGYIINILRFNGMLIRLGLFYAEKIGYEFPSKFTILQLFFKKFFFFL